MINRVTSDVDAIQSFIASGLLGVVISTLTLAGVAGIMFYLNWSFTFNSALDSSLTFRRIRDALKRAAREVHKKEGEIVSVIQEVLTSIRVAKAFAHEEFEHHRLEEESLEGVESCVACSQP